MRGIYYVFRKITNKILFTFEQCEFQSLLFLICCAFSAYDVTILTTWIFNFLQFLKDRFSWKMNIVEILNINRRRYVNATYLKVCIYFKWNKCGLSIKLWFGVRYYNKFKRLYRIISIEWILLYIYTHQNKYQLQIVFKILFIHVFTFFYINKKKALVK